MTATPVYHGDCRKIIPTLKPESIDVVYLDPPFFTQKQHSLKSRDNSTEYSFQDTWASLDEYRDCMREVLHESHRVLKREGSIFLHCDTTASHHLRLLLDEVFGAEYFQSEIIWSYKRWSNNKKGLLSAHQTILFYSKTADFLFNTLYGEYSPTTNIDQILQSRSRNEHGKAAYKRDVEGNVVLADAKKGVPLSDVWHIPFLNPKARERVGYPTQKPIALMERILAIASNEGATVLDPFCGSGSMLVAAQLNNRASIGIDIAQEAVRLSEQRLEIPIKSRSAVLEDGTASFFVKSPIERRILEAFDAVPVERNNGIDGFLKMYIDESPIAIRIQKPHETLDEAAQRLLGATQARHCKYLILVRTMTENSALFATDTIARSRDNLLIVDSFDVVVQNWTQQKTLQINQ